MFKKGFNKYIYIAVSLLIVVGSLLMTNALSRRLAIEERRKMEIWAEAIKRFDTIDPDDNINFELIWKIIESNRIIPAIIADSEGNVINYVNIDRVPSDTAAFFRKKIADFRARNERIEFVLNETERQYVYYDNSILLRYLEGFPYVQFALIAVFLLLCFWAFVSDKKSEQNLVWVGLSKETAHQLGTPISSLLAWEEILKTKNIDSATLSEISKDIARLRTISERFSKIGSAPIIKDENIVNVVENSIAYLRKRTSNKVNYSIVYRPDRDITAPISVPLFEWVIENLCKNAVDAMGGIGEISFLIRSIEGNVVVDVRDTGKGIAKKHFKDVFKPGYTTKQRGWGLGLSLTRRIIVDYHRGKIFVHSSELGKGTVFRIILKK